MRRETLKQEILSDVDTYLLEYANEILSWAPRFSHSSLNLTIRGQIAHLTGTVSSAKEQFKIRSILSGIKGIHAVWDLLKVDGLPPPVIIDLGCGNQKQYFNSIGIDHFAYEAVDIVADVENRLPLGDDTADHIFAIHILEHVYRLIELMNEIHRIIRPGGVLHLMVPHGRGENAVADPTHVRFFNKKTIAFFCKKSPMFHPFMPICVSEDFGTVYADLVPVKTGQAVLDPKYFSYYFD